MPRPPSLKVRALQWLAQREHSRAELRERLLRLARPRPADGATDADAHAEGEAEGEGAAGLEAEVETLLDWLQTHRYLDDRRFVESRIATRAVRFGNRRIEQELRQHGTEPDAATREALRASELQRARELHRRRYGDAPAADAAARVRQMRFLAGRGFSPEVVRQVMRAGPGPDDPADG